jgi:hypothetical protein
MTEVSLPILIVGFLRSENILSLAKYAASMKSKKLYISIDGSRNEIENSIQSKMLEDLKMYLNNETIAYEIRRSSINRGAAVSVILGIDWISNNENEFVILEDDLLPSDDFIRFARDALNEYRESDKVLLVSGNRYFRSLESEESATLIRHPLIWGWATTSKKWQLMRNSMLETTGTEHTLNRTKNFLRLGASRAREGKIDAWDIPLADTMYKEGYLCLLPPVNLVQNLGNDSFATHTVQQIWPIGFPFEKLPMSYIISPTSLLPNRSEEKRIQKKIYKIGFKHHFSYYLRILVEMKRRTKPKFNTRLAERVLNVTTEENPWI